MPQAFRSALSDIHAAMRLRRVWIALACEDIGDQHRRTTLGPLWLLLNYLAFAGTFILVFNRGGHDMPEYAIHVATGLLVWFYIMETLTQSVSLFVREESFIKGTTLPLTVYVMRLAMQSIIRAGYATFGCLAILALSGAAFSPSWLWSGLGILVILAVTPAAITLFAFLGAYFPDSQFIVSNVMRIGMFLTPVFWTYDESGGIQHTLYWWNPFTYFLEIVRAPITTGHFPAWSLAFCVLVSAIVWVIALAVLGRYRRQVVFVL